MSSHINKEALDQVLRLGGIELLLRLTEMFHDTILERLAASDQALTDGEFNDLHRELHSIRSSAGNLGAEVLSDACLDVEKAIKDGGELEWADRLTGIRELHLDEYCGLGLRLLRILADPQALELSHPVGGRFIFFAGFRRQCPVAALAS